MHVARLVQDPLFETPIACTDFERGVIVGLIIGEGTVTLFSDRAATNKKRRYFTPAVTLSSTDPRIIAYVSDIYHRGGLKHFISRMAERRRKKPQHKLAYSLAVQGLLPVHRLLLTIRDSLFAKREQAEVVLAYIDLRVQAMKRHHGRFGNPPMPGMQEADLVGKIRLLNRRGT